MQLSCAATSRRSGASPKIRFPARSRHVFDFENGCNPPNLRINKNMNIAIEHIAIPAADPAALKDWYERVLGAREVFNNGQNPPTCLIALGNVWLEIYAAEKSLADTANNRLAGFRHLALRVDSLAAAKAELERRGVKFSEAERPAAGGGRVLFFEDCEGNLLHLVERPKNPLPGEN
jgi:catechol 2,3-dioxygenase-like lactoylglutathione lyase family enzyme